MVKCAGTCLDNPGKGTKTPLDDSTHRLLLCAEGQIGNKSWRAVKMPQGRELLRGAFFPSPDIVYCATSPITPKSVHFNTVSCLLVKRRRFARKWTWNRHGKRCETFQKLSGFGPHTYISLHWIVVLTNKNNLNILPQKNQSQFRWESDIFN